MCEHLQPSRKQKRIYIYPFINMHASILMGYCEVYRIKCGSGIGQRDFTYVNTRNTKQCKKHQHRRHHPLQWTHSKISASKCSTSNPCARVCVWQTLCDTLVHFCTFTEHTLNRHCNQLLAPGKINVWTKQHHPMFTEMKTKNCSLPQMNGYGNATRTHTS